MATPAFLRRCLRAAGLPVALACAVLALAAPASDAGTVTVRAHVAPVIARGAVHAMAAMPAVTPHAYGQGRLLYNHGPVVVGSLRAVAIFWEPPTLQDGSPGVVSSSYNATLAQYLRDAGSHGLLASASEYYEVTGGTRHYATSTMTLGRVVTDTTAYPATACNSSDLPAQQEQNCLSDGQIQSEVESVMSSHGEVGGMNTIYFVFTDQNEFTCLDDTSCFLYGSGGFCAYHGAFTYNGHTVLYANMPYGAATQGPPGIGCTGLSSFPNDADADTEISTTSHELEETITDPVSSGWYDTSGYEVADKCQYTYGPLTLDGGLANELWNGHAYAAQEEFSNAANSCVRGGSFTVSTRTPARGSKITLRGYNFTKSAWLTVRLQASNGKVVKLALPGSDTTGSFVDRVTIPATTARGTAHLLMSGPHAADSDRETITIS